jgi:REP element-mobilizing transposase RayT
MDLPVRKRLPHGTPQWVAEGSWFFITINCESRRKNQLCLPNIGRLVLSAAAYYHEKSIWHCRLCLLMHDHLHAIIAFPREPGLRTVMSNWKRFLTTRHGIKWQRDFFDHRLRDEHQLLEKTSYILMNPVRKGLCKCPEDWEWMYRPDYFPPPKKD